MPQPRRATRFPLAVLSLEGRTLQSGLHHAMPVAHPAIIGQAQPNLATNPAGIAAISAALSGGMGSEWVKLIRSEVKNLRSVLAGFLSGRITSYSIPGLVAQTPSVQPAFAGQPYDQLLPTLAGASVLKMVEVSRHKSVDVLRGYIRRADLFREHAGARTAHANHFRRALPQPRQVPGHLGIAAARHRFEIILAESRSPRRPAGTC